MRSLISRGILLTGNDPEARVEPGESDDALRYSWDIANLIDSLYELYKHQHSLSGMGLWRCRE